MSELYKRIHDLCIENHTNITEMCRASGASRGSLTDLKMGRTKKLDTTTLSKIAKHFNVSVDYLLGTEETEKAPTDVGERKIDDSDLMFALWGDSSEMTEEDLEDVRRYAEFVRERKKNKG